MKAEEFLGTVDYGLNTGDYDFSVSRFYLCDVTYLVHRILSFHLVSFWLDDVWICLFLCFLFLCVCSIVFWEYSYYDVVFNCFFG